MKKTLLVLAMLACCITSKSQTVPIDIYGVYYSGGKEFFARGDVNTNLIFDLGQISGVNGVSGGYLDRSTNKYVLKTNLGIIVIDANTGQVIDTITPPPNLKGAVYDPATNDVYGTFWNGSAEKFARIDLDSEIVDSFAAIPGVTGVGSGEGYLDPQNGYYIIKTNVGIVVIDVHTGTVVKSFMPAVNMINVVYDPATNDVYGVFWSGLKEKFARIDLDSQLVDSFPALTGVNGVVGGRGYDPETGYYVIATNLGVLVIDRNTGMVVATLSTTMKNLICVTCRKRICPLPVVPSFSFNSSGLTLSINATVSAGTTVYWNFGDGNGDTTTSSTIALTHTYSHADTFRICMTTTDSCGHVMSFCDSVAVPATGIYQKPGMNMSVYPNPFTGMITIHNPVPAPGNKLSICNVLGEEILNTTFSGTRTEMDISHITSTGVYFVQITDNNGKIIYRTKLLRE